MILIFADINKFKGDKAEVWTNYKVDEVMTPLNVDRLAKYLKWSNYNHQKAKHLIQGFSDGFDIGYRGPVMRREKANNIPITVGSEAEMWSKLMKEIKLGRLAGPYHEEDIPFKYFVQSPIGLVPKAGNQTRLIFHLSYNFGPEENQQSVNHYIPKQWCSVKYRDLDYAVDTCLKLIQVEEERRSNLGIFERMITEHITTSIYFSKSDLESAFHSLPILPQQCCYLLMMMKNPNTGRSVFVIDKCLPFGLSISCARYQDFSNCLKHIIEFVTGRHYTVTNYLDDFLFIASDEQECNNAVRSFLRLCDDIGCPVSRHKTEWASTKMTFLGILLNGESLTLSIPLDKVDKAKRLLNWVVDRKRSQLNLCKD